MKNKNLTAAAILIVGAYIEFTLGDGLRGWMLNIAGFLLAVV